MNYPKAKKVTSAHISKLHTVIGKLEYLQNILPPDTKALEDIASAKSRLMRALSDLEAAQSQGKQP